MANETTWTPGPWKAERVSTTEIEVGAETPRGHLSVAWVHLGAKPTAREIEDGTADGALLAAAPDLYEALEALVRRRDEACRIAGGNIDGSDGRYARARAALARARGEEG